MINISALDFNDLDFDPDLLDTLLKEATQKAEFIVDMDEKEFNNYLDMIENLIKRSLLLDRTVLRWSGEGTWEFIKFENLVYHDIFILFDDYPYYIDYRPLQLAVSDPFFMESKIPSDSNMGINIDYLNDDFIDLPF